jgi:hypothetical protein
VIRAAAPALALLALGALIGLAAVALHATWWGFLLAAAGSLAVLPALPPRWWTLPPYAVGWWVPLLVAWAGRREGDYAVESSRYGYGLVVLAAVLVVVAAFLTALRAPGSARRGAR